MRGEGAVAARGGVNRGERCAEGTGEGAGVEEGVEGEEEGGPAVLGTPPPGRPRPLLSLRGLSRDAWRVALHGRALTAGLGRRVRGGAR